MPEAERNLAKAELREIKWDKDQNVQEVNPKKTIKVQFNPETLSVSFTNKQAGGDQRGGSAIQYVGQGSTKLSLDLWFDATVENKVDDVRRLTKQINDFIKPEKKGAGRRAKWIAPGIRFIWGTFLFDGIMESMTEKLEYFSEDGKPLRAMVSISLTSQFIQFEFQKQRNATGGDDTDRGTPVTQPQTAAKAGDTIQGMAETAGRGADWKRIAAANGIENARLLTPGTLIDLNLE